MLLPSEATAYGSQELQEFLIEKCEELKRSGRLKAEEPDFFFFASVALNNLRDPKAMSLEETSKGKTRVFNNHHTQSFLKNMKYFTDYLEIY